MNKSQDSINDVHILNVRVPNDIAEWLDKELKKKMYNSRSEIVRDYIREYLKNYGKTISGDAK